MATLYMTRNEIISDLSRAFREQNDLESMSDTDLADAWMSYGIHAGTWDWDDVCVDRLYYNAEMGRVDMLSVFRDMMAESIQYRQIAYLNLSDSSSLVELESPAGDRRYAIGYQGDDTLHLLSDVDAEKEEEQAGADWHRYNEGEKVFVQIDEPISSAEFDAWVGEHLTHIEYFADEDEIDEIIRKFFEDDDKKIVFGDDEEKYLVINLDSEDTPEFPYIPNHIWEEIEAYDGLFAEIRTGQQMTLAAALVQLKLLRGNPIPEIGYPGHGFAGWDGMIMRVE